MKTKKAAPEDQRTVATLESAWIRVILRAFAVSESEQIPLNARMVVNELRGNQLPLFSSPNALYGCLHPVTSRWLHEVVDGLVDNDLLEEDIDTSWGMLRLTDEGRRVLRKTDPSLAGLLPEPPTLGRSPREEGRLFDLRRKIAAEEGRPAFSIFDNATLARLAQRRPRSIAELSEVTGFGPQRLERYGRRITQLFRPRKKKE